MSDAKIPVGVSACVMGDMVRWNGGHKRDRWVTDVLSEWFDFVKVCPEVELGLGVPRESLRLKRDDGGLRFIEGRTGRDRTEAMRDYCRRRVEELAPLRLRGYILKKDSPSCGMERVRLYDRNDVPARTGVGLYVEALAERFPRLPLEEEGRLHDARLREHFVTRVFAHDRWLRLREAGGARAADVVTFHTAHKTLLMAYNQEAAGELGRLVAQAGSLPIDELLERYEEGFLAAMRRVVSPGRHVNVMQHLAGYLKRDLEAGDRADIQRVIEDYRRGLVPLITPLTLLQHHFRRLRHDWIDAQAYLDPYPRELGLRSAI